MSGLDGLAEAKAAIRETMREWAGRLDEPTRRRWSRSIGRAISGAEVWSGARGVLGYLADQTEPNVDPVLEGALAAGKLVGAPRMEWDEKRMTARGLVAMDVVETRRQEIREPPESAELIAGNELEVILVPGVAFDAAGRRLGRGAGFYDRFLGEVAEDGGGGAVTIGVCFESQVVSEVPAAPHDVGVRMLVTECGLRACLGR